MITYQVISEETETYGKVLFTGSLKECYEFRRTYKGRTYPSVSLIAEDMQRRLKEDKAEEALGTKGLEMAEKLAVDINNNMNKTVLDIVEDTAKSKDKQ